MTDLNKTWNKIKYKKNKNKYNNNKNKNIKKNNENNFSSLFTNKYDILNNKNTYNDLVFIKNNDKKININDIYNKAKKGEEILNSYPILWNSPKF